MRIHPYAPSHENWKSKKRGEGMGRLLVPRDLTENNEAKGSAHMKSWRL